MSKENLIKQSTEELADEELALVAGGFRIEPGEIETAIPTMHPVGLLNEDHEPVMN